ncbi:MAG: hypothetical protein IJT14_04050 [Rickettsiales bacterium]|nr:hypothetical protein [Rickettsiales bacterium]
MLLHEKIDAGKDYLQQLLNDYVQPYNISKLDVRIDNNNLIAEMDIKNNHLKFSMEYNQYNQQYSHVGFYMNNKYSCPSIIGAQTYTIDECASQLTDLIQQIYYNNGKPNIVSLATPTRGNIHYF